jgi:hypothetical protein
MSAVAAAPTPAAFIPSQLVLPSGAQTEFSFVNYTPLGDLPAGEVPTYEIGATYYEVPLSIFANLQTSSASGTRQVLLVAYDTNGNPKWEAAPMLDQIANSGASYTFAPNITTSVTSTAARAVTAIPEFVFYPGEKFELFTDNFDVGDQWFGVAISTLAVPTGELFDLTPSVTPAASPVLS